MEGSGHAPVCCGGCGNGCVDSEPETGCTVCVSLFYVNDRLPRFISSTITSED